MAICDPQRVIPNYSLHKAGRWAGKLDSLQILIDEGLLDAATRRRAETLLREHPPSKPSGRAVVESNDLLLEILRPYFIDGESVDTWGMRTFLYWLSERHIESQESTGAVTRHDSELDLSGLVARFCDATGYPAERDRKDMQARERHEHTLRSLGEMPYENRLDIKPVWATSNQNYGWCGQQASLDGTINRATEASWPGIRDRLAELCFGAGVLEDRIDTTVTAVRGVGPTVATKLLAICHSGDVIPLYLLRRISSHGQALGKLDMIELLVHLSLLDAQHTNEAESIIELHEEHGDCGAAVMGANNLLLAALGPHFTDDGVVDTWGIARFLYWLGWEHRSEQTEPWADKASLETLADELLCDVGVLEDIVELLKDKRQVILYGPPGTGKTYFARHLAWTLLGISDDDEYENNPPYSLVQFHPAYSYEDFFEGFRPHVDREGQMTYKLTSGPLVRLAERAEEHPDELHVMVIDEINRANLPRVLGELLFLLEYRDEWTQTQYRPVDGFTLPSNLWIIGTMNTADRSIALIDAAMRRRFHFVPFFPDREPTAGLLRRWCEQNEPEQTWIADLLDGVNERLRGDLGGDHMLIGPSHFMKEDLDKDGLRRIWEYNIEPLIEDQFFGRREVIDSYRFGEVWKRHGPGAIEPGSDSGAPDGAGEDAETGSTRDEGDESDGDE